MPRRGRGLLRRARATEEELDDDDVVEIPRAVPWGGVHGGPLDVPPTQSASPQDQALIAKIEKKFLMAFGDALLDILLALAIGTLMSMVITALTRGEMVLVLWGTALRGATFTLSLLLAAFFTYCIVWRRRQFNDVLSASSTGVGFWLGGMTTLLVEGRGGDAACTLGTVLIVVWFTLAVSNCYSRWRLTLESPARVIVRLTRVPLGVLRMVIFIVLLSAVASAEGKAWNVNCVKQPEKSATNARSLLGLRASSGTSAFEWFIRGKRKTTIHQDKYSFL